MVRIFQSVLSNKSSLVIRLMQSKLTELKAHNNTLQGQNQTDYS